MDMSTVELEYLTTRLGYSLEEAMKVTKPVTSVYMIKSRAEELSVVQAAALDMRERFLRNQLDFWTQYIGGFTDVPPYGNPPQIEKELQAIAAAREPIKRRDDEVTPAMVEQAREVRVDTIIEFKNGKAHCPFHDDKVPSLFYGTRENRAVCPSGCNDSWDSISLTMRLDGLSFHDAVRKLCS